MAPLRPALAALAALLLTGCVAGSTLGLDQRVRPPGGILFSSQKAPLTTDFSDNPVGRATKRASASETSWFLDVLLGTGSYGFDEAAIAKIARDAAITEISYADYETLNVLGIYRRMTVHVYGN